MADSTRIILPPALGCFVWLAKPRPPMKDAQNPRSLFQLVLIWKKNRKAELEPLAAAIRNAATEKFGASPKGKVRLPIRDGDTERPGYPEFADSYFITVSSERRPPVVDHKTDPVIDFAEDAYSGCTFRALAHVYAYPAGPNYSQGVSIGLDALQVVSKGPRLGGAGLSEEEAIDEFKEFSDAGTGGTDDLTGLVGGK